MRWFTSDWHLGHQNIIDFCDRPYKDIYHMSADLSARYLMRVAPNDDVYFVGDMVMGRVEDGLETIAMLPGNKFLVPGNHDKVWKGRGGYEKWTAKYEEAGFTILDGEIQLQLHSGEEVVVCHFPYAGDAQRDMAGRSSGVIKQDKFSGNRPDDEGQWLVCGHVHQAWAIRDRMINVGVDVWGYRPVAEAELMSIMEEADRRPHGGRSPEATPAA